MKYISSCKFSGKSLPEEIEICGPGVGCKKNDFYTTWSFYLIIFGLGLFALHAYFPNRCSRLMLASIAANSVGVAVTSQLLLCNNFKLKNRKTGESYDETFSVGVSLKKVNTMNLQNLKFHIIPIIFAFSYLILVRASSSDQMFQDVIISFTMLVFFFWCWAMTPIRRGKKLFTGVEKVLEVYDKPPIEIALTLPLAAAIALATLLRRRAIT